jgi:peroxiredoxin
LGDFNRSWDVYEEAGIRVFGLVVDSLEETRRTVRELALEFPVLSGLDASEIAEKTGVYISPRDPAFFQASGYVLKPDGTVSVAVYSTGAIGRLEADKTLAHIKHAMSKEG